MRTVVQPHQHPLPEPFKTAEMLIIDNETNI